MNQDNIKLDDKINNIKRIKKQKYLKNLKDFYEPEALKQYNLGLIARPNSNSI